MSWGNCSLCGESITAPQFYKGAPYGSSCIDKAIRMDNASPDAVRKAKALVKKSADIYMTFQVTKTEAVEGRNALKIWASDFYAGYLEVIAFQDGWFNLGRSVFYFPDQNAVMINFGNGAYNKRNRRQSWKWSDKILQKHGLVIWEQSARDGLGAWIQNPNLK